MVYYAREDPINNSTSLTAGLLPTLVKIQQMDPITGNVDIGNIY
jgi:hypothetical protein